MRVRTIEEGDIERLLWIESIAWRDGVQFKEEHFRSQIEIFPEGQLCFEDEKGKIWGFVNLMRFRFDPRRPLTGSWSGITADGTIATHDPGGNWLFGVNLSVHPHGFFLGATEALLGAAARLCASLHLRGILLVGRMPGYRRWLRKQAKAGRALDGAALETARAYIDARVEDDSGVTRRLDPQIDLYESFGLRVLGPIANFIPDEKSLDFGVAAAWRNFIYSLFYLCPSKRFWTRLVYGPVGGLIERTYLCGLRKGLAEREAGEEPGA